jgi:hypothetical protein
MISRVTSRNLLEDAISMRRNDVFHKIEHQELDGNPEQSDGTEQPQQAGLNFG